MKHKLRPDSMAMHEASTRWPKSACKPALSCRSPVPLKGERELFFGYFPYQLVRTSGNYNNVLT